MLVSAIVGELSAKTARRRAMFPQSSRNTEATCDSGFWIRIGRPLSPPDTISGSIGTSHRKGTESSSAIRFPPPSPKIL